MSKETTIAAIASELGALAAESMAEWKVPGLAIAIVHNGETALLKAYGQRDVEAGLPVTTDTQFTICSITKTFTATGLALLVDEGRLDWTKPVRDYVPEFRLHDPGATDRITVRDLLCHHSGLPRHDWVWMPGDVTPKQMLAAMRHMACRAAGHAHDVHGRGSGRRGECGSPLLDTWRQAPAQQALADSRNGSRGHQHVDHRHRQ